MALLAVSNRSTQSAQSFVLLWATLLIGGCRGLPAPVWQSSTTVGSSATVEASVDRHEQLSSETEPVSDSVRSSTIPLRLVAFEETASDPPYRPSIVTHKRPSRTRSRLFGSTADSKESLLVLSSEQGEHGIESLVDFADEETTPLNLETGEEEFDEYDSGDEALLASDGENSDDVESCRFTFRDDARTLFPMLYDDVLACISWPNALILGAAAGGAIAIRENLDGDVRDYTANHSQKWGEATQVLRQFGEFSYQLPVIAAVYGLSLWTQDEHTHEFSKTLISAYSITALTTVAIKGATNTQRPTNEFQNGEYGFPSYHTASGFAIAAVVDEYYGWPAGLPCYAVAGLVGWSRIDQREHDLSDVFFGSVLGFVIGKSVAAAHLDGITGCQVVPCFDPATRSFGAVFHKKY